MAAIDAWLVAADLLQGPNSVLSAAAPAADLPRLQARPLRRGADGLRRPLRRRPGRLPPRLRPAPPARTAAGPGGGARRSRFDLLFFAVDTLPATVPVAVALVQRGVDRRQATRSPLRVSSAVGVPLLQVRKRVDRAAALIPAGRAPRSRSGGGRPVASPVSPTMPIGWPVRTGVAGSAAARVRPGACTRCRRGCPCRR